MTTLQFAHPLLLVAGLICCGATLAALHFLEKGRQATLEKFAAAQLLGRLTRHVSTGRRRIKNILLLSAIFLLFTALAKPQYGSTWVEVKRKGIDILFALDTSKSMLAEDTKPNRLRRAKLGIMDFVSRLQGDRVGLMPFAGATYLMCPLTLDYDAFNGSLSDVDTNIIPVGGTNISTVITEAGRVLENTANHKILILITDGESLEGDALQAAVQAKEKGMTIYTVGVGTPGGELIPVTGQGEAGFVRDAQGKYVTSRLDEKTLAGIAKATVGLYVPLGNSGEGLERIYREKLRLIPKEDLAERRQKVPIERFGWPLATAILLLGFEYLIPERRSGRKPAIPRISTASRKIGTGLTPMLVLAALLTAAPHSARAAAADEAYTSGDYLKASKLYSEALKKHPDDPRLHYNYGTAAYKNNLFDEAIASFTESLKGEDLTLQQQAYYNRGNALYQKGVESREANPEESVTKWQEALQSYDGALQLKPDDRMARENRDLVAKKLEELRQQLEQQKEQKQNQDKQQDNQQDNKDTKNGDQQKEGKDSGQDAKKSDDKQQEQNTDKSQDQQPEADNKKQNGQNDDSRAQQQPEKKDEAQSAAGQQKENSDKADKQGSEQQPQPAAEQRQNNAVANQDAEKTRDLERREQGKMTRMEAENLLEALKNEEGELNFVPRAGESSVERDW